MRADHSRGSMFYSISCISSLHRRCSTDQQTTPTKSLRSALDDVLSNTTPKGFSSMSEPTGASGTSRTVSFSVVIEVEFEDVKQLFGKGQ